MARVYGYAAAGRRLEEFPLAAAARSTHCLAGRRRHQPALARPVGADLLGGLVALERVE